MMGTDVVSLKSDSRKLKELPSNGFHFPHEVTCKTSPTVRCYVTFSWPAATKCLLRHIHSH